MTKNKNIIYTKYVEVCCDACYIKSIMVSNRNVEEIHESL